MGLAKCTEPGCPQRYRGGPDRPCPIHQQEYSTDDWQARMDALRVEMASAPGDYAAPMLKGP
jgi:hypothetical protein